MSGEGQQSAIAANADVMSELTGSDVNNDDVRKRRNSVEQASVIAQAGDGGPSGTANTDQSQAANTSSTETPAVRPSAASGAASPVKPAPGSPVVASSALQGHARQDLNEKLDDLAPDASQAEAEPTPTDQSPQQPEAAPQDKENTSAPPNGKPAAAARPKSEDELPEGIKALRSKFTGASNSSDSSLPQPRVPVPLPKESTPSASPLSLEVQHKPGSKNFSYKELQGLRLEDGIDPTCKEEYLTDDEFVEIFRKWSPDRTQFKKQPLWRQRMQKQAVGLF